MKKSWVRNSLVLSIGLSTLLAGCSSSTSSNASEKKANVKMNATGLPIVNKSVTLNFVSPKSSLAPNFKDMTLFKELQKQTNVQVKWNNIPSEGYQEKKNLLLSSGDLPDAFYNSGFTDLDIVKYAKDGTIIPLDDLIDKYMPNLKKRIEERPALKSVITSPDGHIYSLPRAEEMDLVGLPNTMYINKTWLDKLGLKMPTTLEEYHDVLKAFQDKDANGNGKKDEIGLTYLFNGWCGNFGDMIAAFGVPDNNDHRIVRDGKVIFSAAQPEYKEAIAYYHKWVKEGIIDPEATTQDQAKLFSKGKTQDETLGSFIWWENTELVGTDRQDDYEVLPPLKGPGGTPIVGRSNYSEYSRDAFVITKADKYPEITARWVDQLYAPKESAQVDWGPLGEVYQEDANGMLVNKELPAGVAMGEFRQKVAPGGPFVVLKDDFGKVVDMEPRAKERLAILDKYYRPYEEKENYPQVFFNEEDTQKINQLQTDITQFVNQKQAHWLQDGGIDKEWNSYVKQLNQMGLPELMKLYQKGLDQFNKNNK
ncbi:ABC transporter substrate-binding protein [Neobacillus cucumis]|uniref:ABC transporter substrate-binding protein n=1 Tax=Neobacillus cucumis TaxID=1740721 RepID=UPI0028536EE1|nr:ABC transporter substrate-binding protein [Neobacillus cucumis]MDR4949649.1 ABC transporter substrate-binding protein [Neobacillus cucumis]